MFVCMVWLPICVRILHVCSVWLSMYVGEYGGVSAWDVYLVYLCTVCDIAVSACACV